MTNQLYKGDNLSIMQSLPDASVDLICTDPPFNTGRDWGAFDDRWEGLDEYLKFMEPRLIECRRVLKETGSLYLHCDPTASHYLKVMLDSVFGIGNFRNEIVWKRHEGQGNQTKKNYIKAHDAILFYTKTDGFVFNLQFNPLSKLSIGRYNKVDKDGRHYKMARADERRKKDTQYYLDNSKGARLDTMWTGIFLISSAKERLGYPTQKPIALYARMIKASSNQGDVVLDLFAGSGTTLDAAQSLGRQWIGIDIGETAINVIQERLQDRHGFLLEYELMEDSQNAN